MLVEAPKPFNDVLLLRSVWPRKILTFPLGFIDVSEERGKARHILKNIVT